MPDDLNPDEIMRISPEKWWKDKPYLACAYALRKCDRIDWGAYLQAYPDVQNSKIDPVLHFLKHGVFEGRCLFCHSEINNDNDSNHIKPKISIIIPNYNNSIYLNKCLDSVVNQTLNDIEIIVIDNGSCDNSSTIINKYVRLDKRVHSIFFHNNKSQHMAKKVGVQIAQGDYIMFLDSDDFYCQDACEIAYNAVCNKYEIGWFRTAIISSASSSENKLRQLNNALNIELNSGRIYNNILENAFIEDNINTLICNKIYSSKLCKEAFSECEDGFFVKGEDVYEFLVIANKAKNLFKIDAELYFYHVGKGVSQFENNDYKIYLFSQLGNTFRAINNYCKRNGLMNISEKLKHNFFHYSIKPFTELTRFSESWKYFIQLADQYGIQYTLVRFIEIFGTTPDKFARFFSEHIPLIKKEVKTIGIYYHKLGYGGIETIIMHMIKMLLQANFKICLFLEEITDVETDLPAEVEVYYVASAYGDANSIKWHIIGMNSALRKAKIDIMLYQAGISPSLLWDTLLLHYLTIPNILTLHACFTFRFIANPGVFNLYFNENVMQNLDKVICLSKYTQAYLRSQNIDAEYIPNPVPYEIDVPNINNRDHNIIMISRLDDMLKNTNDALLVLQEIIKEYPTSKMFFVGDFGSEQTRNAFKEHAKQLKVDKNVKIIGWTDKPSIFIDKCQVLLSTSSTEGFGMAIAEAQARGLPCVIYDLPTMLAENNKSIIKVPQRDTQKAAKEIVRLFKNNSLLSELSTIARKRIKRFSFELYLRRITALLESYALKSSYDTITHKDYIILLKYISFYSKKAQ